MTAYLKANLCLLYIKLYIKVIGWYLLDESGLMGVGWVDWQAELTVVHHGHTGMKA